MRLMMIISVFRVQVTVGDSVLRSVSIVIQVHCVGDVQVCLFGATGHQWSVDTMVQVSLHEYLMLDAL